MEHVANEELRMENCPRDIKLVGSALRALRPRVDQSGINDLFAECTLTRFCPDSLRRAAESTPYHLERMQPLDMKYRTADLPKDSH